MENETCIIDKIHTSTSLYFFKYPDTCLKLILLRILQKAIWQHRLLNIHHKIFLDSYYS